MIVAYRPPSVDNATFGDICTKGLDKLSTQFDNIMVLGDLNYDLLDKLKGETLFDLCDFFTSKTCYLFYLSGWCYPGKPTSVLF